MKKKSAVFLVYNVLRLKLVLKSNRKLYRKHLVDKTLLLGHFTCVVIFPGTNAVVPSLFYATLKRSAVSIA